MSSTDEQDEFDVEKDALHSTAINDDLNSNTEDEHLRPKRLDFESDMSEEEDKENKIREEALHISESPEKSAHSLNRSEDAGRSALSDIPFEIVGDAEADISIDEKSPDKQNNVKMEHFLHDIKELEEEQLQKLKRQTERLVAISPQKSDKEERVANNMKLKPPQAGSSDRFLERTSDKQISSEEHTAISGDGQQSIEIHQMEQLRIHLKSMMITGNEDFDPTTAGSSENFLDTSSTSHNTSLESDVIKLANEISNQRHPAPSNALLENYEKEKFRRKRCEKEIQDLHGKLVETQQQLFVLISTENKKDGIIEELDKSLAKVVDGWKKKQAEKQVKIDMLTREKKDLIGKIKELQEIKNTKENHIESLMKNLSDEERNSSEKEHNYVLKINDLMTKNEEMKKSLKTFEQQLESLSVELETAGREKEMMQREFIQERETFEEKEEEYLQKIEEISDKHVTCMQQAQQDKDKIESYLTEIKEEYCKAKKDLTYSTSKADELERIKEQLSIQIQILQTRTETEKRALKAELEADHEQKLVKALEEQRSKFSSEQQNFRERLRMQIDDLNKRYNENMEMMMKKYNEDIEKKEDKIKNIKDELAEKLNASQERVDQLEVEKSQLEKKMNDMSRRLQLIVKANYEEVMKVLNNEQLAIISPSSSLKESQNLKISSTLLSNMEPDVEKSISDRLKVKNPNYVRENFFQESGAIAESNEQDTIKNYFNLFPSVSSNLEEHTTEFSQKNVQEDTVYSHEEASVTTESSSFPANLPKQKSETETEKLADLEFQATFDRIKILTGENLEKKNDTKTPIISEEKTSFTQNCQLKLSNISNDEQESENLHISKPAVSTSTSFSSFEVPAESVDYLFNSSTFKHYLKEKEKAENFEFYQPEFADSSMISLSDKESNQPIMSSDQRQLELKQYIGMLLQRPNLTNENVSQTPGAPQSPKPQQIKLKNLVEEYENQDKPDLTDILDSCNVGNDSSKESKSGEDNSKSKKKEKVLQQNVLKARKPNFSQKSKIKNQPTGNGRKQQDQNKKVEAPTKKGSVWK
ncbi:DgyrCDS12112 [Dimorphilus gyrociliatus]|uniref:DgyrCDS12112 n=1 Tax=Dimorphilus gyrociliatus TaxID=2664684 RepID=A0A7I8W8H1_9ANNE|nr:DgyrCDS12112 [Dimorphilus gyrociliatus]